MEQEAQVGSSNCILPGDGNHCTSKQQAKHRREDYEEPSSVVSFVSSMTSANDPTIATLFSTKVGAIFHDAALILKGQSPTSPQNSEPAEIAISTRRSTDSSNDTSDDKSEKSIDFLLDDRKEMTWSRRLALSWMRKSKCYNPRLGMQDKFDSEHEEHVGASMMTNVDNIPVETNDAYPFRHCRRENPSLEKAWAYWEHVSLPRFVLYPKADNGKRKSIFRRIINKFSKANKQLFRAEPGEKYLKTELYDPIFTPHKQLGDWGLGFGLYFSTLRALTILTLLAGLLNIPNLMYFRSDEYSDGQPGVPDMIKGSAVCTDTRWVPCPTCSPDDFYDRRIAVGTNTVTGVNGTFALRNHCNAATLQQGFINYATLFLIMAGILYLHVYLERMEVAFDEDEQTAQDYSIIVENPPPDATEPEEWRSFFYDNFHGAQVTCCTVAVDNDLLVKSLVERREKLRQIELLLEPGTSLDTLTLTAIAAAEERKRRMFGNLKAKILPGIPELFGRVVVLNAKVQGLAQQHYPVTKVFITFETERAQRRVLDALNYSEADTQRNRVQAARYPYHLFRGTRLLKVSEPDEPSTVRWQDLNVKFKERLKQQVFTAIATCGAVCLIAFVVHLCNEKDVTFSAFAIAIFNSLFPLVAKLLTHLESHSTEGGKQRSLYFKIALFRWVNTAVVITIIYPFTGTLFADQGLIHQVSALFYAEIVTTNAVQLLDPVGHFQRHIAAPRAATQDAMNLNFQGQEVELAERYTNMTKILFLALWYCVVYPAALFLCSLALFINYFTDRFSLMRTWKRAPQLGAKMSKFSRRYFFSLSILAMALMSSYWWSGFPYDNLCKNDGSSTTAASLQYQGTWKIYPLGSSNSGSLTVQANDPTFRYCSQDYFRQEDGFQFPFVAGEWMTLEQAKLTTVYGWTAVSVSIVVLGTVLWKVLENLFSFFRAGTYKPCGKPQGIPFSEVPTISTYLPQVESNLFSYPLIACRTENLDEDLFDWTDPDRPHSFYDLTKDAGVLLRTRKVSSANMVFSRIAHWPPPVSMEKGNDTTVLKRGVS